MTLNSFFRRKKKLLENGKSNTFLLNQTQYFNNCTQWKNITHGKTHINIIIELKITYHYKVCIYLTCTHPRCLFKKKNQMYFDNLSHFIHKVIDILFLIFVSKEFSNTWLHDTITSFMNDRQLLTIVFMFIW